jgi:hypothetical protein
MCYVNNIENKIQVGVPYVERSKNLFTPHPEIEGPAGDRFQQTLTSGQAYGASGGRLKKISLQSS